MPTWWVKGTDFLNVWGSLLILLWNTLKFKGLFTENEFSLFFGGRFTSLRNVLLLNFRGRLFELKYFLILSFSTWFPLLFSEEVMNVL